ncbi:MFS transporter [Deinococcus irradiatisoli]|uniref:MFS transporter n=1 Tax=Deinococcus irradiatisoli TaxID=2202254 RepID=A0A2Z3JEN4_9DEIO|nr:MFS transporter [Deinococcus irradiatisoli]AWN23502.1 MFS transporter [Deinococcus irradiatisoli]
MTSATPLDQPAALRRNSNFWLWWLGNAQSTLGSALASIALALTVLHLSGSAGALGVNLALSLLPGLASPLLGTLVDRWPLKWPLLAGNLLRGGFQLAAGALLLRGTLKVEDLHLLALLGGLVSAFYAPASMSVLPGLVRPEDRPRAAALMQGASQSMQLLGMVGGGLLVARLGGASALILDGASFVIMAALLLRVRFAPRGEAKPAAFWSEFRAGLRYVRASVPLTLLPALAFFINASLAPMEMLIPSRMQALGAGAGGYGLFFGLLTGGSVLGSLLAATLGQRFRPRALSVAGLAGIGALLLLLSLTRTPLQLYAVAGLLGVMMAVNNNAISLLFMELVDRAYLGRVGSLLNMLGTIGMPLTLLLLAPLADHLPIWAVFAASGSLTLGAAALWHWALYQGRAGSVQKASVPGESSSPTR